MATTISTTDLPLPRVAQGKIRDIYDAGEGRLLIVATDRISAFDVVLPQAIPGKGRVLTQLTAWWLARLAAARPHHLITAEPAAIARAVPALEASRDVWAHRAMLVHRTEPLPVECVVRGYLAGSAWKEYRQAGTLAGEPLPAGLAESERLAEPLFSPATKATTGHDENIGFEDVRALLGDELANTLRQRSLALYSDGWNVAAQARMILADTKFEFGRLPDGRVLLIDEVLTPDSSRFWPAGEYVVGRSQPSLDKQPVRDHLDRLVRAGEWDRSPPAPDLPPEVVQATAARYRDLFQRLTGSPPSEFSLDEPDGDAPSPRD